MGAFSTSKYDFGNCWTCRYCHGGSYLFPSQEGENAKDFIRKVKKVDSLKVKRRMAITPATDLYRLMEQEEKNGDPGRN